MGGLGASGLCNIMTDTSVESLPQRVMNVYNWVFLKSAPEILFSVQPAQNQLNSGRRQQLLEHDGRSFEHDLRRFD